MSVYEEGAIRIEKVGRDLEIRFEYDPEFVERVKKIPGRDFKKIYGDSDWPEKYWTVPYERLADVVRTFPKATYIPKSLEETAFGICLDLRAREMVRERGDAPQPAHIARDMFKFQRAGAVFSMGLNGVLFADEMGLGKTIQSICWATAEPSGELRTRKAREPGYCRRCKRELTTLDAKKAGIGPVCAKKEGEALKYRSKDRPAGTIVVCPASLKYTWQREIGFARPDDTVEIVSTKLSPTYFLAKRSQKIVPDWVIINYDMLWRGKNLEALHHFNANNLIIDECHFIKNEKTKRSEAVLELAAEMPRRAASSGTPIVNRPSELWPTLLLLGVYPKKAGFWYRRQFCVKCDADGNPIKDAYTYSGFDFTGARNLDELHELLKPFTVRRLKKDVLPDLPEKIYTDWPIEVSNMPEYEEWFKGFVRDEHQRFSKGGRNKMWDISELSTMRAMLAAGKVEVVKERLQSNVESMRKILVFSSHLKPIRELYQHFKPWAMKIEGEDSAEKRQEAVDLFQNNPTTIFAFLSTKAAGIGLNLQAADQVLMVDLPWTPADMNQAIDRCHRIGQTKHVEVIFCVAVDTLDEDVVSIIERKAKIAAQVMDGVAPASDEDVVEEIREAAKRRVA